MQADLSGKLDKTSARIQKAEADKAKAQEDSKTLESEIAEIDAGQAEVLLLWFNGEVSCVHGAVTAVLR